MRLLGREVESRKVLERIAEKLRARGESPPAFDDDALISAPVEPRVDPLQYHLQGLSENADPTEGLPLHTHREGLGRSVLWFKRMFRWLGKPFIHDMLGRQRLFNAHARDAYSELAAQVARLEEEVARLRGTQNKS
ncbi:MAG: hypothetical protein ACKVPX_02740 [Myxococcaceae bacterium]